MSNNETISTPAEGQRIDGTLHLNAGIGEGPSLGDPGSVNNPSGLFAIVTKQGSEGGITIDAFTGIILTKQDERPEWAEGLTQALLTERNIFYTTRCGDLYSSDKTLVQPEALAMEDLGWVHVSMLEEPVLDTNTGLMSHIEMTVLEADHEFRMERVIEIAGPEVGLTLADIDREEGTIKGAITEAIARDNTRSAEEIAAMEQASEEGFKDVAHG